MLKTLVQAAILAAGIGLAVSALDSQTAQKIMSSIREIGMKPNQGDGAHEALSREAPGSDVQRSKDSASLTDRATSMVQPVTNAQAREERESAKGQAKLKAFYNSPPEDCLWEKVIDPSDGRVECAVKERRR